MMQALIIIGFNLFDMDKSGDNGIEKHDYRGFRGIHIEDVHCIPGKVDINYDDVY